MKDIKLSKSKEKAEFGDFQTPSNLAQDVCTLLVRRGINPISIVEPTCGVGNILLAAATTFPNATTVVGLELAEVYANILRKIIGKRVDQPRFVIHQKSYFDHNWIAETNALSPPFLIVGNPPWVTNAHLSSLASENSPVKNNFQEHVGLDAMTGKSNFDISEWMLIDMLSWMDGKTGTLAMLVKTSVARKALYHAWKNNIALANAAIYTIDTRKYFDAAVEACLFVVDFSQQPQLKDCAIYDSLDTPTPRTVIGYRDNQIIANSVFYTKWSGLQGVERYKWRSGIKHDCSKIMELNVLGDSYVNGLNQQVELETDYLFPMLKTSDVANGRVTSPSKRMIVTQRSTGEETSSIAKKAPLTWAYLQENSDLLDARKSSIYKKRPPFSVFGIGEYSFSPWKVGISGFYNRLDFKIIGPYQGKPIVLDDSSYFLSCDTQKEAVFIASLLNSQAASEFYGSFIFWDAKRPITVDVLKRLDLRLLSIQLGVVDEFDTFLNEKNRVTDLFNQ
jgi:hypothetical protein